MKRRDALTTIGISLAGGGIGFDLSADADQPRNRMMTTITLLHTNDLHGHLTSWLGWDGELKDRRIGGAAVLAGAINRIRTETAGSALLLDAGDLIGDTMIADLTKGKALIDVFNRLGYDAMTFGNHEPDFGIDTLRIRINEAKFPFLAANLLSRERHEPFVAPYIVKKVNGVSVGILGLTYPKTPWTTSKKNVAEVEFEDPIPALRRELPKLRGEGAEIVIVLSHLGLGGDEKIAEEVEGIDVIVGGHSHNRIDRPAVHGRTLIVQAGAHGSDIGRLELTIQNARIVSHEHKLYVLDHAAISPDPEVAAFIEELQLPFKKELDERIGTSNEWLIRAQTIAGPEARKRDQASPVDSLFADIVRSECGTAIAFLPGVGYGVAIPPGPITAAQLRQFVPHEAKMVSMTLTTAQVRAVLEQALENVYTSDPKKKVGGMIQVSGIRFRYDRSRPYGERIVELRIGDELVEAERKIIVATNSMLAQGGHNQRTFVAGDGVRERGSQYEAIKSWFGRHSPVTIPRDIRIESV